MNQKYSLYKGSTNHLQQNFDFHNKMRNEEQKDEQIYIKKRVGKQVEKSKVKKLHPKKTFNDNEDQSNSEEECNNKDIDKLIFDQTIIDALSDLTFKFELTYKTIKGRQELKELPLKELSKEDIKYIIRKERQNLNRKNTANLNYQNQFKSIKKADQKRNSPTAFDETLSNNSYKRIKSDYEQNSNFSLPYLELAQSLITNFENNDSLIKGKILRQVALLIQEDESILKQSIKNQVDIFYQECLHNFKERNYQKVKSIFEKISPMAIVLINIRITNDLPNLIEEGITLSQTLLPQLKNCINFNFIDNQQNIIATRFIHTLVQYHLDSNLTIDQGLCNFALEFGPTIIQPIIKTEQDQIILKKSFKQIRFSDYESEIMSKNHSNFLWPEMINFLQSLNSDSKKEYVQLLSKIIILQNPEPFIQNLVNILSQRKIFMSTLLKCNRISLTIQQLIEVLEKIKGWDTESIKESLQQDSQQWIKVASMIQGKQKLDNELNEQQVKEFILQQTKQINENQLISFESICQYSQEVQQCCEQYKHNLYQCGIVSIILSQKNLYKIIEMPTGSGKTWIQALISQYYIKQGLKVTIIEPNEQLRIQTAELLNDLSHDLQIISIEQFYDYPTNDEIIIINEYDAILQTNFVKSNDLGITGIWNFLNRNVIFFTATSSKSCEKIIRHIYKDFLVLKFQSEYEQIKQVSTVSQGIIKGCQNKEEVLQKIEEDIYKFYDDKPIIIFAEQDIKFSIIEILKRRQWNKYCDSYSQEVMKNIRSWKYGVLFLEPNEYIGINCKFAIDSIVLITNQMQSEAQYLQTQGRSSRARGLCESIYYPISNLSTQQIIQNMRNQHISTIMELERLIKLIWAKRNVKALQESLEDAQSNNDKILSLKDLKEIMGQQKYGKLIKDFKF